MEAVWRKRLEEMTQERDNSQVAEGIPHIFTIEILRNINVQFNSIQFNSLFQFTQSNTICTVFQIIDVIIILHKINMFSSDYS